jgi:hypothetical protein
MAPPTQQLEPDGTGLISLDPWLGPYADALRHRIAASVFVVGRGR